MDKGIEEEFFKSLAASCTYKDIKSLKLIAALRNSYFIHDKPLKELVRSNPNLEKLVIRNMRGLCPISIIKEFNWQYSSCKIKHLEFDNLNLNVNFSENMISYLIQDNSKFLSKIEFIKLAPFRVENSVQGWDTAEKMAKLVSKKLLKGRVQIDLSDDDPIKQYMENMKIRRGNDEQREDSDGSEERGTVWRAGMR